jgi:hypothetical protein
MLTPSGQPSLASPLGRLALGAPGCMPELGVFLVSNPQTRKSSGLCSALAAGPSSQADWRWEPLSYDIGQGLALCGRVSLQSNCRRHTRCSGP